MDKVVDIRVRKLFEDWANNVIKIDYGNMDEFINFYKDLAHVDPDNPDSIVRLTNVNLTNTRTNNYVDIPIHKTVVKWENPRLKDIEQYGWNAKAFDAIPFRYEINKSDVEDIHNLDVTLEDRTELLNFLSRFKTEGDKYVIEWKDVWMLIYLFFVINNQPRITTFNPDKQKEVQEVFWKAKSLEKKEHLNNAEKFKKYI